MKTVILAGGLGSRLSEETDVRPKPMVEIGGRPILWHIMKMYSYRGFNDFVLLTGYKSHIIKDFFINYYAQYSDLTIDMANNSVEFHNIRTEPWKVTILYTGPETMTGGRLLRAKEFLDKERFMLTYGDGVSDVNINDIVKSHEASGKLATVTVVKPAGRFGVIEIGNGGDVESFSEKKDNAGTWVSGGFFVMEPGIFDYLTDDNTDLEGESLERIAREGRLNAYKHHGFWKAMDTIHDKNILTDLWTSTKAPWALWLK